MRFFVAFWMLAAAARASEPTLVEVQAAAARHAAGDRVEDSDRASRLRASHFAPTLRGELIGKADDRTRRGEYRLSPLREDDASEARTWGVVVTWDLAQLVYSREEGQLALAHQHLARIRREVAIQAAKLWIERRRKGAALEKLTGPLRLEAFLDLLRITAELDALTGGLYRDALKDAEEQLAEEQR
ncbi:MAG: hypothetical protein ACJ79T_23240 [Myxococcales bacterium]